LKCYSKHLQCLKLINRNFIVSLLYYGKYKVRILSVEYIFYVTIISVTKCDE